MNLAKWNTIPKRTQDKLLKAIEEAEYDMVPHYLNLCKQERETAVKAGVTLLELPPDEAKWYVDIAYEADWEFQKAKTTVHYDALRKALGF